MRADPTLMHRTADRMIVLGDEFWDDVDAIRREVESLMARDWTGDAATTHAALWEEWVDSARRVAAALGNDAALLHEAADSYTRTDERTAEAMSSLDLEAHS